MTLWVHIKLLEDTAKGFPVFTKHKPYIRLTAVMLMLR